MNVFIQILFDFGLLFNHIDGNAFIRTWPIIKHTPKDVYGIKIGENVVPTNEPEILSFLHLLKFLPSRAKFENAIKEFIVFAKVYNRSSMNRSTQKWIFHKKNCFFVSRLNMTIQSD